MLNRASVLLIAGLVSLLASCARAADDSQWQAQNAWERFSDHEQRSGQTLTKPKIAAPKHESVLAPVLHTPSAEQPGQSYVLMPGSEPAETPAQVHVETSYVPVVRQEAPYYGIGPSYWGHGPYWGGLGYGHGFGRAYPGGFWGHGYGAPTSVSFRPITRITQSGPSKASGNYYNPSTADPTASGSYFASPTGYPKAAPIIQQAGTPRDYWGAGGNPLPKDMQN